MKFSKIIFGALAAAILAGCGAGTGKSGSEYVGTWQSIKNEKVSEVIERNGDQFLLRETRPSVTQANTMKTVNTPVTIDKDGMLLVPALVGNSVYSIDQKTGNLIGSGGEWKKLK